MKNDAQNHKRAIINNARTLGGPIHVTVELFGHARITCGRKDVKIKVAPETDRNEVASALATACQELIGTAIQEESRDLLDSYILNLNGIEFVGSKRFSVVPGDRLLLFSSQAGG